MPQYRGDEPDQSMQVTIEKLELNIEGTAARQYLVFSNVCAGAPESTVYESLRVRGEINGGNRKLRLYELS
jgi:hypothetical protein